MPLTQASQIANRNGATASSLLATAQYPGTGTVRHPPDFACQQFGVVNVHVALFTVALSAFVSVRVLNTQSGSSCVTEPV